MNKAGKNAKWRELPAHHLALLEGWLFDEKINYSETLERARNVFGFKGSISSVKRFYDRRKKERLFEDFSQVAKEAKMVDDAPGDVAGIESAAIKILSKVFLKRITEAPDAVKEWQPLAKLLLESRYIEMMRELKEEENRIRWERLELDLTKYQMKVQDLAMDALPELNALKRARDEDADPYYFNKWSNAVRTQLFGPIVEHFPESAEEEERMKQEKEARRKAVEEGKLPRTIFPNNPEPPAESEAEEDDNERPENHEETNDENGSP